MPVTDRPLLTLTTQQKAFFDDNGYLLLPGLHTPSEVERMRAEFHQLIIEVESRPRNMSYDFMPSAEVYAPDPYNPRNVAGMMDQTLAGDYWFDQFTDPRVVGAMVDLLGPNIDFHNGKVRNKPPGFVCKQSWHQDFPYERHSSPDSAAAITYLDETDLDAGATEVIPGSHRWGEVATQDGLTIAAQDVPEERRMVLRAQPGDVAIIHVLVLHRAGHNRTPLARHAIINEYKTREAVDQWNNRCAFAGLPLARGGRLVMPRLSG